MNGHPAQQERDESRQARDEQCLHAEQGEIGGYQRPPRQAIVELASIRARTQPGRETHLEITLEVAQYRNEDEELVDPAEDSPGREVFEEFTGEDQADKTEEEGRSGLKEGKREVQYRSLAMRWWSGVVTYLCEETSKLPPSPGYPFAQHVLRLGELQRPRGRVAHPSLRLSRATPASRPRGLEDPLSLVTPSILGIIIFAVRPRGLQVVIVQPQPIGSFGDWAYERRRETIRCACRCPGRQIRRLRDDLGPLPGLSIPVLVPIPFYIAHSLLSRFRTERTLSTRGSKYGTRGVGVVVTRQSLG